jgi:hypothetical protein
MAKRGAERGGDGYGVFCPVCVVPKASRTKNL